MKTAFRFFSLLIASLPFAASAHTGVGDTAGFWAGLGHPVGGADHMLAMVAVGLWAAQMGGKALWAVPGTFVAAMLVGGVLGVAGVPVPYVEQGILVSVLVLGVLISAATTVPLTASALMVGMFAVFHGHAHGAEMPLGLGVFSYSFGFALATALLHGVGIGFGIALQKQNIARLVRFAGTAITLGGVYLAVA
jgi:urease accessory protein